MQREVDLIITMAKVGIISIIALQCIWMVSSTWVPKVKAYHIRNDILMTRDQASKFCQKLGMELLSIKSQEELKILKDHIRNKYGGLGSYWIGAYKDGGVWKWSAYNEVIEPSEMMWHEGQPDNEGGNETCVHTKYELFDWNDRPCDVSLRVICELQLA